MSQQPIVDPESLVKRGRWVNNKDEYPECSECKYMPQYDPLIDDIYYSPYCPNCGAKMDKEDSQNTLREAAERLTAQPKISDFEE